MSLEDSQKRQRVSKACDNCRRKKVRCDGLQPTCSNCTTLNIYCTYLETSKKRGPPKGYIEAIENKLHRMEHLLSDLVESDPRAAESVLAELQKVEGLDDVRLRLANRTRPSEFHELRRRNELNSNSSSPISSMESPNNNNTPERGVWDPVMEALSDDANQLTLDDQGRVRYMGFSSGFYLLQNTEKYQDGLFRMKPLTQCPLDSEDTESNPFLLPIPPVFEHLLDTYFEHINPIIPLLHRENFTTKLKNNTQDPPLFLLNAIFALAANLSSKIQWLEQENARSEVFYKRAKKLLDQSYDVTSLENVQALVLLSHYFHITHGSMKSWVYSGMAIRLAEDLGLHRNPDRWQIKTLSHALKEARKRTWWSCYIMDRNASACMGRPLCIDDRHCDTSLPQLDNTVLTENSPEHEESVNSGIRMDVFVEVTKLHEIIGRIMNNVYAIRAHPTQNPFKSEEILLDLDSALHKWLVELPSNLQYSPQEYFSGKKPASNFVVYLHVLYHSALILLHRPYIPNPNSRVNTSPYPSLQICTTSANSITAITYICSGEPGLEEVLVFILFPIFTAATVHLTNMTTKDIRLANLAKKNLTKDMILLGKIRKRWGCAGKYYIVLRELLIARNISIHGGIPENVSRSTSDNAEKNSSFYEDEEGARSTTHSETPTNTPSISFSRDGHLPATVAHSIPENIPNITPDSRYLNQNGLSNTMLKDPTFIKQSNQSNGEMELPHQSSLTPLPESYGISGAITNVGFDPSTPSNTLSEMTVNNQHLINQFDNSNGAPIWNVPLSFDFDEWNEYVGQYSRNISPPTPVSNGGQSNISAQTTHIHSPPFVSPKKGMPITSRIGEFDHQFFSAPPNSQSISNTTAPSNFIPLHYHPMAQATTPSKYDSAAHSWQVYNSKG
ncbi:hypothetical protein K7432_004516 [Basidiobolus ranarum]|uniref:Zn(2)-C6 fungal-type domain-containing protein n=1 Tax=Basidiobolus ranarum TaxID=34480 RepID=A0ABR2W4G9_9FUNG